jgi:general secretion pathway protein H
MPTWEAGSEVTPTVAHVVDALPAPAGARRPGGFTLLELLVVIAIIAIATVGVSLALRDPASERLDRDAQRLAMLLEAGRAQSRASGIPVRWLTTDAGFVFQGLPAGALPDQWLDRDTTARGTAAVAVLLLGPEPIIGPQAVILSSASQPGRSLRVVTDGLRPFGVQPVEQP